MNGNLKNYLEIKILLREVTFVYCDKLDAFSLRKYNCNWDNNNTLKKEIKIQLKELNKQQKKYVIENKLKELDISILFLIFKHLNIEKLDEMITIKEIRNNISHMNDINLQDNKYKNYFEELSIFLQKNGYSKDQIEEKLKIKDISNNNQNENHLAKELKEKGNACFRNHEFNDAIIEFNKSLDSINIKDYDLTAILYCNISNCYFELFKSENLEEFLDESLKYSKLSSHFNPNYFKSYYRSALIYLKKENHEKTVRCIKKCLAIDPNNKEAKNILDTIKYKLREKDRSSHMFEDEFPYMYEDICEKIIKEQEIKTGLKLNSKEIEDYTNLLSSKIKGLEDVLTGHKYRDGTKEISKDYSMAIKYYTKAGSQNNAEAFYNLGLCYMKGRGVDPDFSLAFKYFEKGASCDLNYDTNFLIQNSIVVGVAECEHSLGQMYFDGIYVEKNVEKAIYWYEKAIEHKNSGSANNLALLYFDGIYVKQDLQKAEKLFLYSHSLGNQQAMTNLVDLYILLKNSKKALIWQNICIEKNNFYSKTYDSETRKIIQKLSDFNMKPNEIKNLSENFEYKDPNAINTIIDHRNSLSFKFDEKMKNKSYLIGGGTTNPFNQNSFEINNKTKVIKFDEIDSTKDHILNSRHLEVITIENVSNSLTPTGAFFYVIKDDNNNVQRLAIYKYKSKFKSDFPIGTKLKIINPYMRLAMDGKPMIRVDDPSTIEVISTLKNPCCVCLKIDSKYLCGNCKESRYCSNECKNYDWKSLNHQKICKK